MPLARKVQAIWGPKEIRHACTLYAVTDSRWLAGRSLAACVAEAIVGGATFVQLRKKNASTLELVKLARSIAPVCRVANVPLVIDDDIDAAKASGVDGVHVGQNDISVAEARSMLGPDAIIGASAQTVDQALEAQKMGASYIGVGALFPTSTKPDAQVVPLEELSRICSAVDIPVVGIGGITAQTIPELSGTGVAGVAVVSAIFAAKDIERATRELSQEVDKLVGEIS